MLINKYRHIRVGNVEGGVELELPPPQFMSTDAHFWLKIGFNIFQSLGKISNISAADPPVLLGQLPHWGTWPCGRCDIRSSRMIYRLQIITKRSISAGEIYLTFDSMYRMCRWSFWYWFDVNRSIFHENMCEKGFFLIFVPSILVLWPLDPNFDS